MDFVAPDQIVAQGDDNGGGMEGISGAPGSNNSQDTTTRLDNHTGFRRACDQCRMKKVRCDKESPCSNCRSSNRACSTNASQKPREPRQRVLISSQYERKIDRIEQRLGTIENLLGRLVHGSSSEPSQTRGDGIVTGPPLPPLYGGVTPRSTLRDDYEEDKGDDDSDASSVFEGNSSIAHQAAWASHFLEDAIQRTSLHENNPKIEEALSSLRHIVQMQNKAATSSESKFPYRKTIPSVGLKGLKMPPTNAVLMVLRKIRETPPFVFSLIACFIPIEAFSDLCQKVYFSLEDYSEATFIIVNTALYYIFAELVQSCETPELGEEYMRHSKLCQSNVETALAQLNLFQQAKLENIEALLMGATYAIELYRPSVAWVLVFQAAQMCQTMGLHHYSHEKDDKTTRYHKSRVFWYTFMLDKGLSLRLGRHPILHHTDVKTPMSEFHIPAPRPWGDVVFAWLKLSVVQGKVYELLYSPAASSKSDEDRIACAMALEEELTFLGPEEIRHSEPKVPKSMQWLIESDEVSYLSTLVLIYRAVPPGPGMSGTFSSKCIAHARKAIEVHTKCMASMESKEYIKAMYIHWTILYAPFVPFIVIFCHAVETCEQSALGSLQSFVASLKSTAAVSEGVGKLYRLAEVLYNVAVTYIEAKEKGSQDQTMLPIGNEFDMYLGQLGFLTPVPMGNTATFSGVGTNPEIVPQAAPMPAEMSTTAIGGSMGGWYSGNQYVMELLEDDGLAEFNPPWSNSLG